MTGYDLWKLQPPPDDEEQQHCEECGRLYKNCRCNAPDYDDDECPDGYDGN